LLKEKRCQFFETQCIFGQCIYKQESPANADKPARRKSMQKLLQFDVFRFISPNSISRISNYRCIASRGMFRL